MNEWGVHVSAVSWLQGALVAVLRHQIQIFLVIIIIIIFIIIIIVIIIITIIISIIIIAGTEACRQLLLADS